MLTSASAGTRLGHAPAAADARQVPQTDKPLSCLLQCLVSPCQHTHPMPRSFIAAASPRARCAPHRREWAAWAASFGPSPRRRPYNVLLCALSSLRVEPVPALVPSVVPLLIPCLDALYLAFRPGIFGAVVEAAVNGSLVYALDPMGTLGGCQPESHMISNGIGYQCGIFDRWQLWLARGQPLL